MSKNNKQKKKLNRRNFVKSASAVSAGFLILPRHVLGRGFVAPSDKVNIAVVGAGGRGSSLLKAVKSQNIVALCDVDQKQAGDSFKAFDKAAAYTDFRVMLEKQKDIDAVMVATPDHTHGVIGMAAMQLGKHVYVEKPLAHNIYEARMMTEMARKNKLITQMGNQGASGEGVMKIMEWINAGLIGDVHKVHCWTNRPIWPQGLPTPTGKHDVPAELDWNLWLGPAKKREYNPAYLPFKWRGWWDFGTGALGDMGCHIIDPPFRALKLGYPTSVECSVSQVFVGDFHEADYKDSCPPATKVHLQFPARENMPEVEMIWYDGGILPKRPEELLPDEPMGEWDGGCIFEGTKGKIMCGVYGRKPTLLPSKRMKTEKLPEPSLRRVEDGHQMSWVNAIRKGTPVTSSFDFAGKLTETVLMGNLAIRSHEHRVLKAGKKPGYWNPYNYPGRKKLLWDGQNMNITNFDYANSFVKREYREGWSL